VVIRTVMDRSIQMLDLFYLAIGAVGFVALWAITKACDRA